ncbi:zinc finger and BTB domain-containing protein 17 [Phlebotomus papatasi]|uniref:zinc finger and BTB domain-containing protein 17 n=1 Tax=Phlebotomus papatasi TaxID=29031 RepID=UPI0024838D57|nr:zinc finger and BTB domain-containing protein 17 [Phlebotomus papatasi]
MEIKNLDLDKICRVCLTVKKDMRPLFGEMVADMLMDFARVQIDNTDGWPDKICVQCVHQVSRCHAFKNRVEKSDQQLRQYIKGITVIVEETLPKEMTITQIELQRADIQQRGEVQSHSLQSPQRQEFQIVKSSDLHSVTGSDAQPQQMIITNGQIHNAQLLNAAGQIVTSHGQPMTVQTGAQIVQAGQIVHQGPILQAGNTLQMINQNGQTQVVQIQRTSDDRCEIIVQPEMTGGGETHYYEDGMITISTQAIEAEDESQIIEEVEEEEEEQQETYTLTVSDTEEQEDKEYLAEFISLQTSCPSPGRYICNLCRKEFKHSKWLHTHMKQHSNWIKANCKKQPQCQVCGRSFKGPGMLKMHMKTHEVKPADKIPTCSICNKEFKSKTILYRHRQTHFEKTFQCELCTKSFVSNYHLKTHMAKHNKSAADNKLKCFPCDKSFTSASELKSHVQQHLSNNIKLE